MDRREAMLRELNLYPIWVRRNLPQGDGLDTINVEVSAVRTEVIATSLEIAPIVLSQQYDPTEPLESHVSIEPGISEQDVPQVELDDAVKQAVDDVVIKIPGIVDLFAINPDVQSQVLFASDEAEQSLREFQLKSSGGQLGGTDWPELKQKVQTCELCKLRAGCVQTVFGNGNEHANWLFIGEAPGMEEDVSGIPFSGTAGALLDNMLISMGLKRDQVYLAGVIKCRPEEDRHPHVGEISACLPYLKRQIELIQPKIIVTLGKTAASALLATDASIASLRGTLHNYKTIPLVVTYHPAYLLRSPMEKAKAWQDLCLAVDTMQGVK